MQQSLADTATAVFFSSGLSEEDIKLIMIIIIILNYNSFLLPLGGSALDRADCGSRFGLSWLFRVRVIFRDVVIGKEPTVEIKHVVGPFKLAELDSHVVKGDHSLGLEVAIGDFGYLLIAR
jgi:hypothetical protein